MTPREEVVGVVSVDSLREVTDDGQDTTFSTHEINFYQVLHYTPTVCAVIHNNYSLLAHNMTLHGACLASVAPVTYS